MRRYRRRQRNTPGSALPEAKQLISRGQLAVAQKVLHECLKPRRRQWTEEYEEVMLLYVDIAVKLRSDFRKTTREAFHHYRLICKPDKNTTQVSTQTVESLAKCLNHFTFLAEREGDRVWNELQEKEAKRVEEATKEFLKEAKVETADELNEADKARLADVCRREKQITDKLQYNEPYLKYQWDAYRCVLESMKNNSKLDPLYQRTAVKAANYCQRLRRTGDFRKLCDTCRRHLEQIPRYQHQDNAVKLSDPEIRSEYLKTRFTLLETATKLGLWQEAFKNINDVNDLLGKTASARRQARETLSKGLLATYYLRLSQIFWHHGSQRNYLFYAYSLWHYYILSKEAHEKEKKTAAKKSKKKKKTMTKTKTIMQKSMDDIVILTAEELKVLQKKVVLAVLCILPELNPNMLFQDEGRMTDVAEKLGFTDPCREWLVNQILQNGLVKGDYHTLLQTIENPPNPLRLCRDIRDTLENIMKTEPDHRAELELFKEPIETVASKTLVYQLSKVYLTISLDKVKRLLYDNMKDIEIEDLLIECIHTNVITGQLDLMADLLVFTLPSLNNQEFTNSIVDFGDMLQKIQAKAQQELNEQIRETVFKAIAEKVDLEHQRNLSSKRAGVITKIMKRVAYDKQQKKKRQRHEQRVANLKKQKAEQEELMRKKEEAKKQEKERRRKEIIEQETKMRADKIKAQIESMEDKGKNTKQIEALIEKVEAGESVDQQQLNVQFNQMKQKQHTKQKQKLLEERNRVDYGVRAVRYEELPLLEAQWKERQQADVVVREKHFDEYCRKAKKEFKKRQNQRKKLRGISHVYTEYLKKIDTQHARSFEQYSNRWKEDKIQHDQNRQRKLGDIERKEREQEEKRTRRAEELRMKQEEQQRLAEERAEEEKRQAEEEERRAVEKQERQERERAERAEQQKLQAEERERMREQRKKEREEQFQKDLKLAEKRRQIEERAAQKRGASGGDNRPFQRRVSTDDLERGSELHTTGQAWRPRRAQRTEEKANAGGDGGGGGWRSRMKRKAEEPQQSPSNQEEESWELVQRPSPQSGNQGSSMAPNTTDQADAGDDNSREAETSEPVAPARRGQDADDGGWQQQNSRRRRGQGGGGGGWRSRMAEKQGQGDDGGGQDVRDGGGGGFGRSGGSRFGGGGNGGSRFGGGRDGGGGSRFGGGGRDGDSGGFGRSGGGGGGGRRFNDRGGGGGNNDRGGGGGGYGRRDDGGGGGGRRFNDRGGGGGHNDRDRGGGGGGDRFGGGGGGDRFGGGGGGGGGGERRRPRFFNKNKQGNN